MSQSPTSRESFYTGLIMQMATTIGWPAFKALVAKLESANPKANQPSEERPSRDYGRDAVDEPEPAAPEAPPIKRGWGRR